MGVLGYKQLTITAEHADKKKMHSPITREVHPIFYGLSILTQIYLFRLESYLFFPRTLSIS